MPECIGKRFDGGKPFYDDFFTRSQSLARILNYFIRGFLLNNTTEFFLLILSFGKVKFTWMNAKIDNRVKDVNFKVNRAIY